MVGSSVNKLLIFYARIFYSSPLMRRMDIPGTYKSYCRFTEYHNNGLVIPDSTLRDLRN